MKWQITEMTGQVNAKLINDKSIKCKVNEMINWWNEHLMKWTLDEMTTWWNEQLMK
jgi:hypothetical protein